MQEKLNILIADDHDYFLDGLQLDIKKLDNIGKIYRANNGLQVLTILKKTDVDILVLDIQMPKLNGVEVVSKLKKSHKQLKIIVITSFYDIQHIKPLIKSDIKVILDKLNVKKILQEAFNAVLENRTYYSAQIKKTANTIMKNKRHISAHAVDYDKLTRREKNLFPHFIRGLTNNEISKLVFLSAATIDTHRKNIYHKFGVKNAAKLVVKAHEYGLLD